MSVIYPIPKFKTLLWRGCRKKCPQCGQGALFKRWITVNDNCPVCGLQYLPDQGDLWGMLLFIDRALFIIPLIVIIYFRLMSPDLTWLLVFGGGTVAVLVLTLPHRLGMNLAIDYLIRRNSGDLVDQDRGEAEKYRGEAEK